MPRASYRYTPHGVDEEISEWGLAGRPEPPWFPNEPDDYPEEESKPHADD